MDNTNRSEQYDRAFRNEKINDLIRQLQIYACGYDQRLLPLISGRHGEYSEERMNHLLDGLMEELQEIAYWIPECEPELCTLYRSLFYCAIRVMTTAYTETSGGGSYSYYEPENSTFGDLLEQLLSSAQENTENIDFGRWESPMDWRLSQTMSAFYSMLTGRKPEGEEALASRFIQTQELHAMEEDFLEHMGVGWDDEDAGGEIEDAEAELRRQEAEGAARRKERQAAVFRSDFRSAESYCSHYETVVRLFGKYHEPLRYNWHLRTIMEQYLLKHGYSVADRDDDYFVMIGCIKKALKIMKGREED